MLLTFERSVVYKLYFALPHFLAEDPLTTNVEDTQDKNGLSMTKQQFISEDEETEVSISIDI